MDKRYFCYLLLLFFLGCQSHNTQDQAPPSQSLEEAIAEFNAAFAEADVEKLSAMITADYRHTNGHQAPIGRQAWLQYLAKRKTALTAGTLQVSRYELVDPVITRYDGSAMLTGVIEMEGVQDSLPFSKKIRITNLWVIDEGKWKRAAFQDAKIPLEPAVPPPTEITEEVVSPNLTTFQVLGSMMLKNLDKTVYMGNNYDYWPDGGIKCAFNHLRSLVSYQSLRMLIPHDIYLSGPHTEQTLRLDRPYSFGHYNPEFLSWLDNAIQPLLNDEQLVKETTPLFQEYVGQTTKTFWLCYLYLNKYPEMADSMKNAYQELIAHQELPRTYYYDLAWQDKRKYPYLRELNDLGEYLDFNVLTTAVAFWLRRKMDGTEDQMFDILDGIMEAYYPEYVKEAWEKAKQPAPPLPDESEQGC